jgi:predicted phage-related endonuclease
MKGTIMKAIPKPIHGTQDWLNLRHRDHNGNVIFGASEAGALMGVSEFTSQLDLAVSKLSPPVVTPPTAAMIKGIIFEPALGEYASRELGMQLITPDEMYLKGRWIATLDFVNQHDAHIVEAKVTSAYAIDSAEDLPASWIMQGHVQHWCTGYSVSFVVFDKRQRLVLVDMPIKRELIDELNYASEELGEFLDQGVIPEQYREWLTAEQIQGLYKPAAGTTIEADEELVNWITDYETSRKMRMDAEKAEKFAKDMIAQRMLDAESVVSNGFTVLSWKQQKGRTSFDQARFETEHPDLYSKYLKTGSPIRVMRLGKGK